MLRRSGRDRQVSEIIEFGGFDRIQSYEDIVSYIDSVPKFTSKTSLAHTEMILAAMGHPEEELQVLHVAGTNGKGSVCADLDAMLRAAGYHVGLFTSPHLIRINERFRIDGREVSDVDFAEAFQAVMQASKKVMEEGEPHPTYFEILFLMGIWLFQKAAVEYVIFEVGMGGRLDATNVIKKPLVSVITSVSLDHMQYLGETIPEIAGEKAGIIKPGVPVVYDAGRPEVSRVIEEKARQTGSPAYPLEPGRIRIAELTEDGAIFSLQNENSEENRSGSVQDKNRREPVLLKIPQIAPYQVRNAALAWYVLQVLREDIPADPKALAEGLASVSWPCRMQKVEPGVYIDGAHNPDGIACFLETAEVFHRKKEITLLFSAVGDKDYRQMVKELASLHPERVVTARIRDRRAVSEEELAELFRQEGCTEVYARRKPEDAYRLARKLRGDGILFCVGSLYLAGELLQAAAEFAHSDR